MSTVAEPVEAQESQQETVDPQPEARTPSEEQKDDGVSAMLEDLKKLHSETLNLLKQQAEASQKTKGDEGSTDIEAELAAARKERDEARKAAEDALRQSILIHKGIKSPRFSKQILSEYDGSEDFETFVDKCKADKDLSLLFRSVEQTPAPTETPKAVPAGPAGGSGGARTGNTRTAEATYRAFAEERYPGNKALQDAYVRNRMAQDKRGN